MESVSEESASFEQAHDNLSREDAEQKFASELCNICGFDSQLMANRNALVLSAITVLPMQCACVFR